jgi:hypothetical protein
MGFEEFTRQFFQGMPALPAHVLSSYKAFYEAGLEEGRALIKCPGCAGEKVNMVRVQRSINGRRFCESEEIACLICQGSGLATSKDVDAFFAREFPEADAR